MTENKGTRADLPPGGGVDEIKYEVDEHGEHVAAAPVDAVPDDDLEYTGENGDGQEVRVPPSWS